MIKNFKRATGEHFTSRGPSECGALSNCTTMKLALHGLFPRACNLARRHHAPTSQMNILSGLSIWPTCTEHPLYPRHCQGLGTDYTASASGNMVGAGRQRSHTGCRARAKCWCPQMQGCSCNSSKGTQNSEDAAVSTYCSKATLRSLVGGTFKHLSLGSGVITLANASIAVAEPSAAAGVYPAAVLLD